ncbi:hypothetical protein FMJ13_03705 [Klebsiella michiganensis]|nr:hypothetical protein [Klebsiella michiganensis]
MTTDITELAQRMKAAAVRAKAATEDYVAHHMSITVYLEECKEFNDLSDGPDNILALVEALESEKRICATWRKTAEANSEKLEKAQQHIARQEQILLNQYESLSIRRGELEAAQQERENWRTSFDNERFRADKLATTLSNEIEQSANVRGQLLIAHKTLLNQQAKIAEMEEAEQKLCAANVTLDARAELAERQLAEMESRTVTIEPFRSFVTDADLAALHRFAECCDDPESGGHDLEKEQVRRLEAIGALQRSGRISYITGFGDVLISITNSIKWETE